VSPAALFFSRGSLPRVNNSPGRKPGPIKHLLNIFRGSNLGIEVAALPSAVSDNLINTAEGWWYMHNARVRHRSIRQIHSFDPGVCKTVER